MQAIQPWLTRPVFLSSTFRDMHAERDYLRHQVFPKLAEDLRERRCHLETIELASEEENEIPGHAPRSPVGTCAPAPGNSALIRKRGDPCPTSTG